MDETVKPDLEFFLTDESFRLFVADKNKEAAQKWTAWLQQHPESISEFDTAIDVMKLMLKPHKQRYRLHTEDDLNQLLHKIHSEESSQKGISFLSASAWLKIAAVLILVISVAGWLIYKSEAFQSPMAFNEIIVPLGEKSQIVLSDGTHIWINSSSKLKYPVDFSRKNRTVYLEGEAFFDVTHNEKLPFIVHAPNMNIKVLGTSFNIKNYPGDKNAVTTVVRGLVRVEPTSSKSNPVLLKQNENIVVYTGKSSPQPASVSTATKTKDESVAIESPVVHTKVNVEEITSWKDQMLVFNYETMEDVVVKMERWYNVKISILDEDLKKERYRGKFVNNETIYQVLEALKFTTPITYKFKNNEFLIEKPK